MKKEGWDCMRHYEILGSRCVPWFVDISQCPSQTCTTLPKNEFLEINKLIDQHGVENLIDGQPRDQYNDIAARMHEHFVKHCTTKSLAKYILDAVLV
jgi:hypothetical protein